MTLDTGHRTLDSKDIKRVDIRHSEVKQWDDIIVTVKGQTQDHLEVKQWDDIYVTV